MGSQSAIGLVENIIRAVTGLPNYFRNVFYRDFKDIHIDDHKIDL